MEIGIQIVSEIRQELESILDRCGIMYRLFAREIKRFNRAQD